jgi:hypothetical protein
VALLGCVGFTYNIYELISERIANTAYRLKRKKYGNQALVPAAEVHFGCKYK